MRTPAFDASGAPPDDMTTDEFRGLVRDYMRATGSLWNQTYFVDWLGVHIHKLPNDIVALHEVVEETGPTL